jgi:hypothetical protein
MAVSDYNVQLPLLVSYSQYHFLWEITTLRLYIKQKPPDISLLYLRK